MWRGSENVHEFLEPKRRPAGEYFAVCPADGTVHRNCSSLFGLRRADVGADLTCDAEAETLESLDRLRSGKAASRLRKNRIADEMEPDAIGRLAIVEIGGNRFSHLLLKIAQVFALCRDPAGLAGAVPRRDKPARLFVADNLKGDFIHRLPT